MKRKFTFLIAALALLTMIVQPGRAWGQTTYEQLTSIANIDESAQYVLGIDGTGFHYEGTSSWGKTALPSAQTPIYYTLTKASDGNSFTAQAIISGTTYYLQIPTSNTFSMATSVGTNTDIIIGTTQVSETNYAVTNKTTTTRHLRLNGTSGLRSYAGTTGSMAYFYKVVPPSGNTYTVTYYANNGTETKNEMEYNEGVDVTIAANSFSYTGHTFTKWHTNAAGTGGTDYNPGDVIENISANIDLYAQWEASSDITKTLTATNLELTTSYPSISVTKTIDGITYEYFDLMKNSNNIQAKATSGTIKNTTAYPGDITSVVITHSGTARATTINGSADGTNWTQVATGDGSINANFSGHGYKYFQITRGSNAAYWTKIEITYSTGGGGSLDPSDLAITNASTDLTFDLYSSATAQVINYTTSSTGAITITPASPTTYFSYVHDAQNKTITVTPLAVTPSAQIVTISQAADDDYYAGTATFTVSVANSTPLANIAALTAQTTASEYTVALSNAVVTYVGGSNAYIQDASGAVMMHKSEHGLTAGDVLNGTATVAYQLYNANPQITNLTGVTPVSGTAPDPTEVAQSAWNYTFNNVLSQYFKVTGATITQSNSKYYVSLNNENIQLYKQGGSISTLDLTKTYSITGFPTLYNSTKELTIYADPEVETSPEPSVTVTPNVINAPAAGADGSLALTYENITSFIAFDFYFCDANGEELQENPDWIDAEITAENDTYSLDYIIYANDSEARTAYIKVYTFDDNLEEVSAIVTVNQAEYVVDYATLPFAYDGNGLGTLPNGLTQEGLTDQYNNSPKMKFDGTGDWLLLHINERPGTLTFDIKGNGFGGDSEFKVQTSADGTNYTDLATYTDLTSTVQSEEFDNLGENVRYIKWIYTEKVNGNVALGNIGLTAYDNTASITVAETTITAQCVETEGMLGVTYTNITTISAEVYFCNAEGQSASYDWIIADIDDDDNVAYLIEANDGESRTAYFKVWAYDDNLEAVYSDLVTVTQAAYSNNAIYTLVTSIDDITPGLHYLIASGTSSDVKIMDAQGNNNRGTIDATVAGNAISLEADTYYDFVISGDATNNWTIVDESYGENNCGYLYASSSNSNQLKTRNENSDDNSVWAISLADDGTATITAKGDHERNVMRYNPNNNNAIFACYASTSTAGSLPYLYKKNGDVATQYYSPSAVTINNPDPTTNPIVVINNEILTITGNVSCTPDDILILEGGQLIHTNDVAATLQKNVAAYTAKDGDGWYLIATPVDNLPKTAVASTSDFDLFLYNEPNAMWYAHWDDPGFETLYRGKGYLYANAADVDLNYAGTMKATNANINIDLDYTSTLSDAVRGFNLVGNPFTCNLKLGDMQLGGANLTTYYVTNTDRTALQAITSDAYQIKPGEGFFVQATAASQQLSFNASSKDDIDFRYIKIVAGNENGYDNAYIQMGDCNTLRKMNIANKTEVYVMDGEDDYAAARVEELAGSMPVHFKAIADGEYTITIEAKYTDVYYMHLFDNFTGEDIDLMLEPSYTFHAAAEDAENRFLLVFDFNNHLSVNENYTNDVFAYQYGDEIIINGEGELQIFDVMGRMVLNTKVNGVQSFNVPSNGVYILRIIGNDIKTQKIVVK